ncbi:DUF4397 domain-containing protein [Vibrio ponticus]|uniref:DUF4397 domain-containing protein n=1 Tax=Vibrio ponticus TaxID=265668 RepID=A0A3N3DVV7_9VIBR|nr:DUF4397 domain-containing protein [Vibrio ponticus]ROV58499.1 DUF4397 domain-containing protein [Vibrio ponticus]
MKNVIPTLCLLSSSLFLFGCDDDEDNDALAASFLNAGNSSLQAVHASADAPRANVIVNGSPVLEGVDYAQGSGYLAVPAGLNTVQVDVALPGNSTATVVPETIVDLSPDLRYTAFVVGDADGSPNAVEPLIVTRPAIGQANSQTLDVQVVHAASGVGDVNLYVSTPGVALNTLTAIDTLAFKDATTVLNIPAGDYQIRLETVSGGTLAFDSGPVTLAADSELTIAAVPRADSNPASPVKLLVLDGSGSSVIFDNREPAETRVGHLINGAPNVDVYANGGIINGLTDVAFKTISPYLELTSGSYDLEVFATGTNSNAFITANGVALNGGLDYSVFAVGTPSSPEALVIEDNRRAVATSAVLNVTHAAANPIAASVDVYLTANASITGETPTLEDFAFKQTVSGIYVPAGDYFVTVTVANDPSTIAINAVPVTLTNGAVYQATAIDDSAGSGFNLIAEAITD